MRDHNYSRDFTVSKKEVYEYILINGMPQSDSMSRYSMKGGFHFLKKKVNGILFLEKEVISTMKKTLMIMSLVKST